MGNEALKQYARASYGVDLSDDEVENLSNAWLDLFPERIEFLRAEMDLGLEVAKKFEITPDSHYEYTASRNFYGHSDYVWCSDKPNAIVSSMLLKVLKNPEPVTQAGKSYDSADIDYFWDRVESRLDVIPANLHQSLAPSTQPSFAISCGTLASERTGFDVLSAGPK